VRSSCVALVERLVHPPIERLVHPPMRQPQRVRALSTPVVKRAVSARSGARAAMDVSHQHNALCGTPNPAL